MNNFIVISGCSGGGKSTLLLELARRGFSTVEEPGRRIVRGELASGGDALPWRNVERFARRAIETALGDYAAAQSRHGYVFFDRCLIDAAAALQQVTGEEALETVARRRPYHNQVFLAPPWQELFTTDDERRHSFEAATLEYERLVSAFSGLGYQLIELPMVPVTERADFLLQSLGIENSIK